MSHNYCAGAGRLSAHEVDVSSVVISHRITSFLRGYAPVPVLSQVRIEFPCLENQIKKKILEDHFGSFFKSINSL